MTSFEDAARRMLGAPPDADISSDMEIDGGFYSGCDTCGYGGASTVSINVWARLRERYPNGRLKPKSAQVWHREFTDLPSLWAALFTDDETDEA